MSQTTITTEPDDKSSSTIATNYEERLTLSVHQWNIRSLRRKHKQGALAAHLELYKPSIMLVCETWLNYKAGLVHDDYDQF